MPKMGIEPMTSRFLTSMHDMNTMLRTHMRYESGALPLSHFGKLFLQPYEVAKQLPFSKKNLGKRNSSQKELLCFLTFLFWNQDFNNYRKTRYFFPIRAIWASNASSCT